MEEFKKKLADDLRKHRISRDYSETVESLFKGGVLRENMPYKALLNTFLVYMSKSDKLFESILKSRYAFDLTCTVSDALVESGTDLAASLETSFTGRLEYAHIERSNGRVFIGLKFSKEIYTPMKNSKLATYLYPYKLLLFDSTVKLTDFTFDQVLVKPTRPEDVQLKYAEFIAHLTTLKLPLSIACDDLLYETTGILPIFDVFLYLEASSHWPREQEAIECAKTAFYCQLYIKSKWRHSITKDFCVFKYRDLYFKVRILIKADFNPRYKTLMGLQSVMKKQDDHFHRKVHMVKTLFARLGLYPLHFEDYLLDLICAGLDKVTGDAKFLENLLRFSFDMFGATFDLETQKFSGGQAGSRVLKVFYKEVAFNLTLPSPELVEDVKARLQGIKVPDHLITDDFELQELRGLGLDVSEYDIVLSKTQIPGSSEIIGNITDDFDLGTPDFKTFSSSPLFRMGEFLYDPLSRMLLVRAKPDMDVDLLANLLILETSFEYIKMRS